MSTQTVNGKEIVTVDPKGLTLLAEEAYRDIAHLLRPAHLQVSSLRCGSVVVSIAVWHDVVRGSIPGSPGVLLYFRYKILAINIVSVQSCWAI